MNNKVHYISDAFPSSASARAVKVARLLANRYPGYDFRTKTYGTYLQVVFTYEGQTIDDPSVRPDKRASADPVIDYGMEESDAILMYVINENSRR